jgi:hypothetical protein
VSRKHPIRSRQAQNDCAGYSECQYFIDEPDFNR